MFYSCCWWNDSYRSNTGHSVTGRDPTETKTTFSLRFTSAPVCAEPHQRTLASPLPRKRRKRSVQWGQSHSELWLWMVGWEPKTHFKLYAQVYITHTGHNSESQVLRKTGWDLHDRKAGSYSSLTRSTRKGEDTVYQWTIGWAMGPWRQLSGWSMCRARGPKRLWPGLAYALSTNKMEQKNV